MFFIMTELLIHAATVSLTVTQLLLAFINSTFSVDKILLSAADSTYLSTSVFIPYAEGVAIFISIIAWAFFIGNLIIIALGFITAPITERRTRSPIAILGTVLFAVVLMVARNEILAGLATIIATLTTLVNNLFGGVATEEVTNLHWMFSMVNGAQDADFFAGNNETPFFALTSIVTMISLMISGSVVTAVISYIEKALSFVINVFMYPVAVAMSINPDSSDTTKQWFSGLFAQLFAVLLSGIFIKLGIAMLNSFTPPDMSDFDIFVDTQFSRDVVGRIAPLFAQQLFVVILMSALLSVSKNTDKIMAFFGLRTMSVADSATAFGNSIKSGIGSTMTAAKSASSYAMRGASMGLRTGTALWSKKHPRPSASEVKAKADALRQENSAVELGSKSAPVNGILTTTKNGQPAVLVSTASLSKLEGANGRTIRSKKDGVAYANCSLNPSTAEDLKNGNSLVPIAFHEGRSISPAEFDAQKKKIGNNVYEKAEDYFNKKNPMDDSTNAEAFAKERHLFADGWKQQAMNEYENQMGQHKGARLAESGSAIANTQPVILADQNAAPFSQAELDKITEGYTDKYTTRMELPDRLDEMFKTQLDIKPTPLPPAYDSEHTRSVDGGMDELQTQFGDKEFAMGGYYESAGSATDSAHVYPSNSGNMIKVTSGEISGEVDLNALGTAMREAVKNSNGIYPESAAEEMIGIFHEDPANIIARSMSPEDLKKFYDTVSYIEKGEAADGQTIEDEYDIMAGAVLEEVNKEKRTVHP